MKGEIGMKKYIYILLVLIMLVSVTPAAAKGGGIRIVGEVTAIYPDPGENPTTGAIVLNDSITVQVTSDTSIYITVYDKSHIDGSFSDLDIGQSVRVIGVYHGDIIVANKIIIH
jgi:hypothetical protein